MLKYVFGAIFIAIAWVGVHVIGDYRSVAIWTTVVIVGGLALNLVIRYLLARQAARKIESALSSPEPDDGLRPEVRAQIQEMQAEFQKALRTLKSSKLAKHGKNALAALPWYVIIGPPGSGKSTVLRNSGLKFPYLSAKRGSVRGMGGTRNCDWWLANEGILLDTAGRWTTEEDDQDEWLAFLDTLKKTRRGQALNGIMVAIGAGELLDTAAEPIPSLAKKLRDRIDEVMGRLEVTLPVYLVITKCDLVAGFVETFGALSEKERGQIWGLTLPLEAGGVARPEMFVERLDRLVDTIETRALVRLKTDRRLDVARRLYEFPQEFEELCPGLVDLINDLFSENAYQDSPVLRGVYFTSATQEGRPIDRIVQKMAKAIGLSAQADYQPVLKAKSYFLRDVFRQVIFPDQNVAGIGEAAQKRRRLVGYGVVGAAFAAAFGITLTPLFAYTRNLQMASGARDYVDGLMGAATSDGGEPAPARLERLASLSKRVLREAIHPETSMTFGFYQGDRVNPMVARVARDRVVRPILAADFRHIGALARPNDKSYAGALAALHLQKLLTGPKGDGERRPGKRGAEAIDEARKLAVARWQAHLGERGQSPTPDSEVVVADAVELYLREAEDDPELWEARDSETLGKLSTGLCDFLKRAPLQQIVGDPSLTPYDVSLNDIVAGSLDMFVENPKLGGAYTQSGWPLVEKLFERRSQSASDGAERDWALQGCEALSDEQLIKLRKDFLAEYEDKWGKFLDRIRPRAARDFAEASARIGRYASEKPLVKLWQTLGDRMQPIAPNSLKARADNAVLSFGDKLFSRRGEGVGLIPADLKAINARFDPLLRFGRAAKDGDVVALDTYYGHLRTLVSALKAYEETPDDKALQQAVTSARRAVDGLVSGSDVGSWGPTLRTLLLVPLQGLSVVVDHVHDDRVTTDWYENVVVPYQQDLADHYPFGGGLDAEIPKVTKFFHPQTGALWQYVKEHIAADVEPNTFKSRPTSSVHYTNDLSNYLQRAQKLGDLLFGSGQLGIPVEVKVQEIGYRSPGAAVEATRLLIGKGPAIVYRNETARFVPLPWPNPDLHLSLHFVDKARRDFDVEEPGNWALFRFIGRGKPHVIVSGPEKVVEWKEEFNGAELTLYWKPSSLADVFKNMTPPRAIVAGRNQ